MYDSRNVENNPTKGIWAEAHAIAAPKWLGSSMDSYKVSATFRQYVPLGTDKVVFAYRLAYQGFLGKNTPWYLMPFYSNMGYNRDYDAIGGYRTVRGLMLDRVQGLHTGFYNVELRYRFVDFQLFNQNIAFAVSGFTDGAHVFKGYDLTNRTGAKPELYKKYIDTSRADGLHASAGGGLRFIMNQNFIIAFEYARCFNKQDGKGALYINTGFLF
jgi:outer membrane protein assembly factor BamA